MNDVGPSITNSVIVPIRFKQHTEGDMTGLLLTLPGSPTCRNTCTAGLSR